MDRRRAGPCCCCYCCYWDTFQSTDTNDDNRVMLMMRRMMLMILVVVNDTSKWECGGEVRTLSTIQIGGWCCRKAMVARNMGVVAGTRDESLIG